MASHNQRVRRDTFIWAAILAGHGLLLALVLRIENRHSLQSHPDVAAAMAFVWLSRPRDSPPTTTRAKPTLRRRVTPMPRTSLPPQSATTTPEAIPRIDWFGEGQLAAAAAGSADAADSSKPGTFSPVPKGMRKPCQPHKSSMEWKESRFGMAGAEGGLHLPYVMLGKRCVLGLGFFGCSLGPLPEANSHLLDDMHDPELSRRSVPAVEACE